MIVDRRTPEGKARMEREAREREAERSRRGEVRDAARKCWTEAAPWQPIESCPFEAYDCASGADATFYVTDGKSLALVSVKRRFGRPVRCIREPGMILTDDGVRWEGGEYVEYDRPAWWFRWELEDVLSPEDERFGKDEIDFVPTLWLPPPSLPK